MEDLKSLICEHNLIPNLALRAHLRMRNLLYDAGKLSWITIRCLSSSVGRAPDSSNDWSADSIRIPPRGAILPSSSVVRAIVSKTMKTITAGCTGSIPVTSILFFLTSGPFVGVVKTVLVSRCLGVRFRRQKGHLEIEYRDKYQKIPRPGIEPGSSA